MTFNELIKSLGVRLLIKLCSKLNEDDSVIYNSKYTTWSFYYTDGVPTVQCWYRGKVYFETEIV